MGKAWLHKGICERCKKPFEYVSGRTRKYDDNCLASRKEEIRQVMLETGRTPSNE